MEAVAELVKQGLGVVHAQQGRLGAREVVVVDDDRRDDGVHRLLVAIGAHPGAGALVGPGERVGDEDADVPFGVTDLVDADVGMIGGDFDGDEGQAEEPGRGVEGGSLDRFEREERL